MAGEIADQLNIAAAISRSRMPASNDGIDTDSSKTPPLT